MSLVGCAFNEVHGVTRDDSNHNFGDYLWYPGSNLANISYCVHNFEIGNGRNIGCFILLHCMSCKRYSSWWYICRVPVHLVCNTDITGGFRGTISTWGSRRYNVIHMVVVLLEIVILIIDSDLRSGLRFRAV